MVGSHSGNHVASTVSPRRVVLALIFAVSAACVLLATGCGPQPPLYILGLKPELPRAEREAQLHTLRPTFRWEPFPRAKDLVELDPNGGKRITAVSYELRLWKSDYKYWEWRHECRDIDPGELVYIKQGLITPEHNLEFPLQPNSLYYWTVRAHFRLDGQRRVTEWSEVLLSIIYPKQILVWKSREDGCSYPTTFHLIRTPKEPGS